MSLLIKLICLWGLADAVFLGANPSGWKRFWHKGVGTIGSDRRIAVGMSLLQTAICVWMLKKAQK
jgi:hypothetical protein